MLHSSCVVITHTQHKRNVTMFVELLIFGTFWFWVLVAAEIGWLVYCAAAECKAWQSLISVLLFLGILQCISDVNVLQFLWHNPVLILATTVCYLLGGCVWVFPKWWLFCKEHLRKYMDLREAFLRQSNLPAGSAIPDEHKDNWAEYYKRNNGYYESRCVVKPEPGDYKNRIITWMTLWPLSFLWTMLNDPIVRFFQHIYYEISGVLRRISENVFKDVAQDFEKDRALIVKKENNNV